MDDDPKDGFGRFEIRSFLLGQRFTAALSAGIFVFFLLRTVLPQSPKRRRVTIRRAIGGVIKALWRRNTERRRPADTTSSPATQLQSQQITTVENIVVEPLERFHIWNNDSILKAVENMVADFNQASTQCVLPFCFEESNKRFIQYSQFSSLDHGDFKLLNHHFLIQLGHVNHQSQIIEPDYQQMLNNDIMGNSDILVRSLFEFLKSRCLLKNTNTCMDAREFTFQFTTGCVMILKIATGLLCVMWKELAEVNCQSFDQDLKNYCFAVSSRQHIENLIEAVRIISNVKWPASRICDIYQMLVLYEAIDDVLPALQKLRWGSSQVTYPNASDTTFQQMRVNFKAIFDEIISFIDTGLNGSQNGETCDTHSVTIFLLGCMKLFMFYSSLVKQFSSAADGSNLLLENLISYWEQSLGKHAGLYTEGRKYMFPLNNLKYFAEEIKTLLQALLDNSEDFDMLEDLLKSMISKYTSEYLEEYWQPILKYLKPNPWRLRAPWTRFNSKLKEICDCQGTLALHVKLKEVLREEIRECLTPSYDRFLEELKKKPICLRKFWEACSGKCMTTEELIFIVDNLFESSD